MSASVRIRSRRCGHERQTRGPHADVVGHDEDFGEKTIDGRAQRGDLGEGARVVGPRRGAHRCPAAARRALRAARAPQARSARRGRARGTSASSLAMFLTRLNSTASAWKSSEVRIRCSASASAPRPQRSDVGCRDDAHGRSRPGSRAARARSARARPRTPATWSAHASGSAVERLARAFGQQPRPRPISRSMPVSSGRSIRMRTMPCICRRSPNGSREPVARSPACSSPMHRIELVGERHRRPRHRRRAEIRTGRRRIGFDADRQVVVIDRLPDRFRLPFLAGVDAAHRPLQLGELEDHVGREIGLGEPGGRAAAPAASGLPSTSPAIHAGQLLDALGLVAIAAQLLVKEHRVQPLEPRLERRLAIALPEEPRIAQPRGDHALGVLRDQPLVLRLGVDDGEERFLQLAAIRHHREIVLMVHQRGREHLLRQREERRDRRSRRRHPGTRRGPRPRRAGADAPSAPPGR